MIKKRDREIQSLIVPLHREAIDLLMHGRMYILPEINIGSSFSFTKHETSTVPYLHTEQDQDQHIPAIGLTIIV